MITHKHSFSARCIAVILILSMLIPINVCATGFESRASLYLSAYNAYVYLPGTGEVRVYFDVSGTNYMDEIGALSISLYESTDGANWTWKKTFTHDMTAGMLSYIDDYHSGHVSYNGVAGRYYKAYVCIWAGKGGQGDSRYFWTSVKH